MDDAHGRAGAHVDEAVGVVEGLEHLTDHVQGDRHRQRPHIGDAAQVATDDVLEGDVEAVAHTAHVEDRADISVAELHHHPRLLGEASQQLRVVGAVVAQHLEDTVLFEAEQHPMLGQIHIPHAASAHAAEQHVGA